METGPEGREAWDRVHLWESSSPASTQALPTVHLSTPLSRTQCSPTTVEHLQSVYLGFVIYRKKRGQSHTHSAASHLTFTSQETEEHDELCKQNSWTIL